MNNRRMVKKSAMIQRRCGSMIVQDDSDISDIDPNIEQYEDGQQISNDTSGYKEKRFINKETQSFK